MSTRILFGLCSAFAALAKFTALGFFPLGIASRSSAISWSNGPDCPASFNSRGNVRPPSASRSRWVCSSGGVPLLLVGQGPALELRDHAARPRILRRAPGCA